MKKLLFLFPLALVIPNIALALTEHQPVTTAGINIVLPFCAYCFFLTLSRNMGRSIWLFFPIVFLAAFQLVLLYLFGRAIIGVDMFLNLVTTNAGEVEELLGNMLPAIAGVVVLYVPFLVFGIVAMRRHWTLSEAFVRSHRHQAAFGLSMAFILSLYVRLSGPSFRFTDDIFPVNVAYNLYLAMERTHQTARYAETSKTFRFKARSVRPDSVREVCVLVIGETARAENFQLYGYPRPTNPHLTKTGGLTVFSDVMSQSNTTHKSVPMLLSAVSADNYDCIYRQKSIVTAFREAGFRTAFLSNQRRNHSFIDIFGMEAHNTLFIKDSVPENRNVYDEALLPYVEQELLRNDSKLFIVLHTYGSHFNYRERYPHRAAFFIPDEPADARKSNRQSLVNAYDNSIRYTDDLLYRLITLLQNSGRQTCMLYTADHGEDIFDDNSDLFLHASPVPSRRQLQVPLMVWLSPGYRTSYASIAKHLHANRTLSASGSRSVFHTLLKLGGIRTPFYRPECSLADPAYRASERLYLTDRNRSVTLKSLGVE